MVIEDDAAVRTLVAEILAEEGYEPIVAPHGAAALALAREREPDLILLDLNLPRKDGREVLAEIKKDHRLRLIPVVVLTTSQAEQDLVKTYDLHANAYVTKPLDLERFIEVVQAIEEFWFTIVKLPPRSNG